MYIDGEVENGEAGVGYVNARAAGLEQEKRLKKSFESQLTFLVANPQRTTAASIAAVRAKLAELDLAIHAKSSMPAGGPVEKASGQHPSLKKSLQSQLDFLIRNPERANASSLAALKGKLLELGETVDAIANKSERFLVHAKGADM